MIDDPSTLSVIAFFIVLFVLLAASRAQTRRYTQVGNVYTPTGPKLGGEGR